MKIMFVCTANTCRSAMAEAILKTMVEGDVEVYSCGVIAKNGKAPSKNTVSVCRAHGIDITNHRATYFKDAKIDEMDLVLTLEHYHKEKIKIYYPNVETYTIREFIHEYPLDIPDPVGGNYSVYDACFGEIFRVLKTVSMMIWFL